MGFQNPPVTWKELEGALSDRRVERPGFIGDGGDSPAWTRKREPYAAPAGLNRYSSLTPYAELHCHSSFSFLDGASDPESLVTEAARLGLEALAITDHNGFYGISRFAQAAAEVGLPTIFGAELTIGSELGNEPDPAGQHLLLLARNPDGYAALARVISESQLAGEKGAPRMVYQDLHQWLRPNEFQHLVALTGCRKGIVPAALEQRGPAAAERQLRTLVQTFGSENVLVELWDHGAPLDTVRNDALVQLAANVGVEVVATNNVHYATPAQHKLASAMAAVRSRRSLDEVAGWLPPSALAHLRSGDEQARRFARYPGVVERAARVGLECAFDLALVAPNLPPFPCPGGISEMAYLRQLVAEAAVSRYGPRDDEYVPGAWKQLDHELDLIEHLGFPGYFLVVWDIVEFCRKSDIFCQGRGSAANSAVCYVLGITKADAVSLGLLFERFLAPERDGPPDIDLDIESDRREEAIQYVYDRHGRRHAAQVANVITYRAKSSVRDAAKALGYASGQQDAFSKTIDRWSGLKGQTEQPKAATGPAQSSRSAQGSWPQGDPGQGGGAGRSGYQKPKRERQPAVVVSGGTAQHPEVRGVTVHVPEQNGPTSLPTSEPRRTGETPELPDDVIELAAQFEHLPRHLGIHSGGMVMCDRPVIEVCPVEWGRMEDRTVLQWDKEDCAFAGLVKFDLLGLGMLSALHYSVDLIKQFHGEEVDLAAIPQEDEVYEMLCRADSIGVFQVESRAQMSTLPRLRPQNFYDLVVEIALIRPGPIQGGSVHPYIRRRNGKEPVTYLHPLLKPALEKTLGVPLFQEQLMQMAIDVAGFTASEADELRRAMGSKRSVSRMNLLQERFAEGTAANGITPEITEQIWVKLVAFANYGFPESHSISFAYLVYASSWIKLHYPAAFCAALLNAQPMGFYSPHSLVQDARRHGVPTLPPDINLSGADAVLAREAAEERSSCEGVTRSHGSLRKLRSTRSAQTIGSSDASCSVPPQPEERDHHLVNHASLPEIGRATLSDRRDLGFAVRLGIGSVRGIGDDLAEEIALGRPYRSIEDVARRTGASQKQMEALATAGAFDGFVEPGTAPTSARRTALWVAGAMARVNQGTLPGIVTGAEAPQLPGMSDQEEALADLWATGVAADGHPTKFVRNELDNKGAIRACDLGAVPHESKVWVGGVVTHRQRPATAAGVTFLGLEDETGLMNIVVSVGCWARFRRVVRNAPALMIRGKLERTETDGTPVVNIVAEKLEPLDLGTKSMSRDFR